MKKLLLMLIVSAVIFGCTTLDENTVARAAKTEITKDEFDQEVAKLTKAMVPEDYVLTDEEKLNFEIQILNNMIMKIIYEKEMDRLDIVADPQVLESQYAQLIAQYGSEEKLEEDIVARGFTVEELKKEFEYQIRLSDLSTYASEQDTVLSDEELRKYYDENKDTVFSMPATVNSARHILIQPVDGDTEKALEDITKIRDEIIAGKDFAEAAVEYSQGPSGVDGGQLGQFQEGQMVKEFEMVAFAIPLNQVSEPVLTQFGYHLILVEDRVDASYATFEETKEYINNQLKVENYFTKLEEDANIVKPDWAVTE